MERIIYRKTLDVHKNGIQFMLQGFQTADNLSRVVEISLMASGDAIDFPLERIEAMMYVTTPGATEPSINKCTIKDNKVVYEVLPIVEEGITNMQLKIMETSPEGATRVLASPEFAVEVSKSNMDDGSAEQSTTFTALEDAVSKAKTVYDERFLRMELDSECVFKAWYADGTYYETDVLQRLFRNGNVLLSESFAHGGTGVRAGEDTDNSKYYSNVAKSEALNAQNIMENSEEILEEVKLHGVYTAFAVNFATGEVEYVSPSFKFNINLDTGHLDAIGQTYSFNDEVGRIVVEWLRNNNIILSDLQAISTTHTEEIAELKETTQEHTDDIKELSDRVTPIENGGTGASTPEEAIANLGIDKYQKPWNLDENVGKINSSSGTPSDNVSSNSTPKTLTTSIKMINSGNVQLRFKSNGAIASNTSNCSTITKVEVYKNEECIYTESNNNGIGTNAQKNYSFNISVSKGDILKVAVSAKANTNGTSCIFKIENLSLYANVDTPYKYVVIPEGYASYTAEELLDTLLGVQ